MKSLTVLYFSPVGSSKKIAEFIVEGMLVDTVHWVDLTLSDNRNDTFEFDEHDNVLMVFPVYAGRIVRIPRYLLKTMRGNGATVIPVVTFGNRAFDDALKELHQLVKNAGFIAMGAAAFVCEHAFDIGLASKRPHDGDRRIAQGFGRQMQNSIHKHRQKGVVSLGIDAIPGCFPPRTQFRHDFGGPLVPSTSQSCTECMRCVDMCPVGAISPNNPFDTDETLCITCFRCIRRCHVKARDIDLEDFRKHAKWLSDEFQDEQEPQLFFPLS